ncbi:MAG: carbohydrate kinase, partial [Clostridia bacterium]|nr:carbohydrate kinase [Clostridia bacterium]
TRELAERNPEHWKTLSGVGITGQGDGMWPIDENGEPVYHALLWNDTRSRDIDFDAIPGVPETIKENHTNQIFAGSVCALLTWMKRNRPREYGRIRWVLHCKDWLNYKLTGRVVTDNSDASTCVYDHVNGKYVPRLLELAGIPECLEKLPPIVPSTEIIGGVTAEASALTMIPEGTKVAEGCVDVCGVAVGSDVTRPGRSCTIIGTTLCCEIALTKDQINYDEDRGLLVHHAIPHLYMRLMPTLSGASTMDFARDLFFPGEKYLALEKQLEKLPIGSEGLIYHPYICGERAPIKNPFATAGFFGLRQTHTTMHMLRSVFEGLACSFYDCYQALEGKYKSLYLSGGAAVSPTVCQMFCDMIGLPCNRVDVKELGTLGMARILQVALGMVPSFEAFADQKATSFVPDMDRHAEYVKIYQLFKDLQIHMGDFWKARVALVSKDSKEEA